MHRRNIQLISAVWLILTAGWVVAPAALAKPYLSVDFQNDTAGKPPAASDCKSIGPNKQPQTAALVADADTLPADPFGPAGNKSLMLRDSDNQNYQSIWWKGAAGGLTAGEFSEKFYLTDASGFDSPYTEIRLGEGMVEGSNGRIAIFISLSSSSMTIYSGHDKVVLKNPVKTNTPHALFIRFDANTHTFSGTLDGEPLSSSADNSTTFRFMDNTVSQMDSILFNTGWTDTVGAMSFHDDVTLMQTTAKP